MDTIEKYRWVCDHFQDGRVSPNHGPTRGTWFLEDPAAGCDWPGSHPHLEGVELWEGGAYWSIRSTEGEWRRKYEHTRQQCKHTHTSKYTHINSNAHIAPTHTQTHAYPRNWAPVGPTSMMRPASPSPSTIGGIEARRCLFTSLHVTRVGAEHFLGGTMIRRPLWRQPRMAPPLASTMKLTKKLKKGVRQEIE